VQRITVERLLKKGAVFLNFKKLKYKEVIMFRPLDIKEELQEVKRRSSAKEEAIIREAQALLSEGRMLDEELLHRLKESDADKKVLDRWKNIDAASVYTIDDIRTVCIRYRLRFLDTRYFKREFPYKALVKIKTLERASEIKIEKFKIIAPSEAFDLEDTNKDPLLFAELSDGKYYLLHKWGKDLSWYRRIITWPLQDLSSFFITLVVLSAALAFSLPKEMLVRSETLYDHIFQFRMMFMMQALIGSFFFIVFIGLAFHKNLSSMDWNSKCFN
jgi:hypothetical protein